MQHMLDSGGVHSRGSDFDRDAARAEGLGFESVGCEFVRNLGKHGVLCRREFHQQRHQHALAFHFLRRALFQDSFKKNAFMRHVLVDNPQPFVIDCENKRLANLSQGLERCQGGSKFARGFRFIRYGRRACVHNILERGARQRYRRVCLHANTTRKLKSFVGDGRHGRFQCKSLALGWSILRTPRGGGLRSRGARARSQRGTGRRLCMNFGHKLGYRPRFHQRGSN